MLNEFNLNMNFSPIDLNKLKNYLIHLSEKYGLGDVFFRPKEKNNRDSMAAFYIRAPIEWSFEKLSDVWDKVILESLDFSKKEGIIKTFDNVCIVLTQRE